MTSKTELKKLERIEIFMMVGSAIVTGLIFYKKYLSGSKTASTKTRARS